MQFSRYNQLAFLCFLSVAICYADRIVMSIAIVPMSEHFNWTSTTQGAVLSSFFVGYLLTQVLGGYWSDKIGGHRVLLFAVALWSAFTLITPFAAIAGLIPLVVARIGMGAGEGTAFPAIYSLYGRILPEERRARTITFTISGVSIGTIMTLATTPLLIERFGWQAPFYLYGVLGLMWAAFWLQFARKHLNANLEAVRQSSGTDNIAPPMSKILKNKAVWAIIVAHFCSNWSTFVLLSWMPTYVSDGLGIDFAVVGIYAMVPFVCSFLGMNLAGWVAQRLSSGGMETLKVRKLMTAIGFGVSAVTLFLVGFVKDPWMAIGMMSVGTGIGAFVMAGFGVNHLDIAPKFAGTLMGLSNTAATIPGIVGVFVSGLILEVTGSWAMVFGLAGVVTVIGLATFTVLASASQQFEDAEASGEPQAA